VKALLEYLPQAHWNLPEDTMPYEKPPRPFRERHCKTTEENSCDRILFNPFRRKTFFNSEEEEEEELKVSFLDLNLTIFLILGAFR
jgi:hypothetical protein